MDIRESWQRERVAPNHSAYEEHTTAPHSETGESPAVVMLVQNFRSTISNIRYNESDARCLLSPPQRGFLPGNAVYVINFGPGPKWFPDRVLRRFGHVTCELVTADVQSYGIDD
ncbi:hypothetical protein MRX96_039512 [Rhipicephalus microplus]